jgi:hypothetical protein
MLADLTSVCAIRWQALTYQKEAEKVLGEVHSVKEELLGMRSL